MPLSLRTSNMVESMKDPETNSISGWRRWFSKEGWKLRTDPASFATREGWSNSDVDVVPPEQRRWRELNYLFLWLSDGANVGTMQQAGSIISLGLSWREAAVAIAIGNIIIAITTTLNGIIGAKHHIPFPIISRASMGFYFSYFAVLSRLALGLIYFGINTYIGASCTLIMLESIWPSFKHFPNRLPPNAGVTSNKMIAYFLFWCLQFPLVLIHPRKMRWLFLIKSLFAVTASFALLGWCVHTAGGSGPIFSQDTTVKGSERSWAWVAGMNIAISGKTTLAINMPDLTRYARKPSDSYWQLLFIPLIYFSFSFIGILIASSAQTIYHQLYWDPTSIISLLPSRSGSFFCAFAFGLATLGTNISTNSIATSNDLAFLWPGYVNLRRGAFVTSLVGGWLTFPWKIQQSAKALTTFLSGYIVVLAPILGIMITDYWIVRKGKLHIPMLYSNQGIYRYTRGINFRALVTLLIVVPVNIPGLVNAIRPEVKVGIYDDLYKASWFFSFFIAIFIYLFICWIFPPTSTFVSETVEEVDEPSIEGENCQCCFFVKVLFSHVNCLLCY
ncbi:hypothetical protein TREMEDRAFT_68629 [Tremella mesenterica DSM 1558]|uniref:uncharacterized protein n=1 Tax=Tremella mesenterica (strain ATCC 24925 / CBS 8224 / DSM 1558 / NBRC 9311 / NRRL Y-6157 / RJB 2259-6 / UBC 559-6) TaxID=578456 RepID=UPI0003F494D8|nr:uncharacterized protein TREMEDRAFT_68629 [Tremella mesenterica DSM 1558]EIW69311.1 hypothetical protein TREMEDRAFT_68629 [Tremella mesenterica DSM 1558]